MAAVSNNRCSLVGLADNSDDSNDGNLEMEEVLQVQSQCDTKRGKAKKYYFQQEYPSLEAAKKALKEEQKTE